MLTKTLTLFVSLCCFAVNSDVIQLSVEDFHEGVISGAFDVILDTRTPKEFKMAHLPNATFVDYTENFRPGDSIPEVIANCKACRIVTYCQSGGRAQGAAEFLVAQGFNGAVYNGMGVSQWIGAGYDEELEFTSPSVDPPCASESAEESQCRDNDFRAPTAAQDAKQAETTVEAKDDSTSEPTALRSEASGEEKLGLHPPRAVIVGLLFVAAATSFVVMKNRGRVPTGYQLIWSRTRNE